MSDGGLSSATGDWTDAGVILFVAVVNTAVGVAQEVKAGQAIAALSEMTAPDARVPRGCELGDAVSAGTTVINAPRSGQPLEVTLDREIAGTLPGSFEVAGNALRVITPRSFVGKDDDIIERRTR